MNRPHLLFGVFDLLIGFSGFFFSWWDFLLVIELVEDVILWFDLRVVFLDNRVKCG